MSVTGCTRWCCSCDIAHLFAQLLSVMTTSERDQLRTQCTSAGSRRRSVKPWSLKCGKVNFNTELTEVCLQPPPPPDMPRWAHYCFISLRHQLSPALDCVSHKKAESRAASHCGILHSVEPVGQNSRTHILQLHFLFLSHKSCSR